MNENFIRQTASDYDMSFDEVKSIYEKWFDKGLFYEKLEEFLSNRSK
jgi:hypothetical protein